jgi:hypothetical protein
MNKNVSKNSKLRERRRREKIVYLMKKIQLNRTNNCMDTEFTNIIQPIMNSVENEGDLLTNIFIVTQLNTIVCKTTREINKINMKDAGSVLLDDLQELAKNFAMNKNRIDLIRVMLGLIK